MEEGIRAINELVEKESAFVQEVFNEIGKVIVGQRYLLERLLIGLLVRGHILIEGVPGLAKTLTAKTFSEAIDLHFSRIQFTPDLLPADLIGTLVYNPKSEEFVPKKGPIFTNILLADEINRAPAKVQSALLEAMQERQVTIGKESYSLPEPFLVLATQNPIEQEGTYPLPEAQIDRFLLKLKVDYPNKEEEYEIMERMSKDEQVEVRKVISPEDIIRVQRVIKEIYVDKKVKEYILNIVLSTRPQNRYLPSDSSLRKEIDNLVSYGASVRATIYLNIASKAHAFLKRRGYVTPEDVKSVGLDVLRHRIIINYEAEAEGITSDDIARRVLEEIEVP
ncbi:MAG: ATPase [Candidatus Omnitrophota bacterium]|nr:MAG: ATPase [Candidatus Omnitrophota bacterium]